MQSKYDSTLAFLREPYRFISNECKSLKSEVFESRLFLQKTIFMTGKKAAEAFYNPKYFVRKGAAPEPIRATLFGKGGIQSLDGEAHLRRKKMFMSIMTEANVKQLVELTDRYWQKYSKKWISRRSVKKDSIILYDEVQKILMEAVCEWAGVPLKKSELIHRTKDLVSLFDDAALIGISHFQSRIARKRTNQWISNLVKDIRNGNYKPEHNSPVNVISFYNDIDGELLKPNLAAIEIINLIRPTVAVSVYVVFAAHALYKNPKCRASLAVDRFGNYAELMAQEIRRFYPFFPNVVAKVRDDFEWNGHFFPKGRRVVLDLYGTNHDPKEWKNPDEFNPDRFANWNENPFNFISQGGGYHNLGHRCPGEWITVELLKLSLDHLVNRLVYDVPAQNLKINYSRLPALPQSHFIISNIKENIKAVSNKSEQRRKISPKGKVFLTEPVIKKGRPSRVDPEQLL